MVHRVLSVTVALCAAVWLVSFPAVPVNSPALAQANDAKPAEAPPAANQEPAKEPAKEPQKIDEFAEAQRLVAGPAGNPECVWFGRRVVSLLWRDDLDTAFRHLDLYDRFGCPSGHVQATFRCLLLHPPSTDPKADPKAADLTSKVSACWINPSLPATPAPTPGPAAAAPSSSAAH